MLTRLNAKRPRASLGSAALIATGEPCSSTAPARRRGPRSATAEPRARNARSRGTATERSSAAEAGAPCGPAATTLAAAGIRP